MPPENTPQCTALCTYMRNSTQSVLFNTIHITQGNYRLTNSLRQLRTDARIKIVIADKNLGLCVLTIEDYHRMVMSHLDDADHYTAICDIDTEEWNTTSEYLKRQLQDLTTQASQLNILNRQASRFLTASNHSLPKFHVTPKLHKDTQWPCPTRPIIGAPSWTTTNLAIFLTTRLERIACPYVLRDSIQLITDLEGTPVSDDDILISADVTSLYTMMSLTRLYDVLRTELQNAGTAHDTAAFLVNCLRFICDNNYFQYGQKVFKQTDGIAMGSNASCVCANVYLNGFDKQYAPHFRQYRRFIDDCFAIYRGEPTVLTQLITRMNNTIEGITINVKTSTTHIDFMDLTAFKHNGTLAFRTYQKAMNIYQYLPPQTCHYPPCIRGYIKGEIIRYCRTNTLLEHRLYMRTLFYTRLLARSFSKRYLDPIFSSVDINNRRLNIEHPPPDPTIQTLVVPYNTHPTTIELRRLISRWNDMELAQEVGVSFRLAFTRPPNILQLTSTSNISEEQARICQEEPPRQRPRLA